MKINIGKHPRLFGPYQLAEALCFWAKPETDEFGFKNKPLWVHKFGEFLAHGSIEPEPKVGDITKWDKERKDTWLSRFLQWFHSKRKRTENVKIDRWDSWNADHTLALIILPVLKQLKVQKQGAPMVDDDDVPEELRSISAQPKENEYGVDVNYFKRWDWVIDEMIRSFEMFLDDSWQDKYRSGNMDLQFEKLENGMSKMIHGPNHTYECDYDGIKKEWDRIDNGFRLFGKYYRSLWS